MRKLVVASTILLTLSGLWIAFIQLPDPQAGARKAAVLAHIWLGVAYLVVFPLYAWDHISKNRRWLTALRSVTASGLLQLTCGVVVLLTGIVLLAYGGAILRGLRAIHHGVTYPLAAALLWHYLSPKVWPAPAAHPNPKASSRGGG
jgi:heme/copper-type cytochrome/quinol oxidase subunit 3